MWPSYPDKEFDEKALTCSNCGWNGQGHEAVVIDFYGVTDNKEAHCPQCDKTIAIVQKSERPPGESASDLSYQFG